MSRSSYEIATQDISISDVYAEVAGGDGYDMSYSASSPKMHCPFGFLHSDGGYDKSFRMYGETNSAYCFACSKRWNPVQLYADAKDLPWRDAADALLELFQISKETQADRWNELTSPKTVILDTSALAESLRLYCQRVCPNWEEVQFIPQIADVFSRCLALLGAIDSESAVEVWRARTKEIMLTALTNLPTSYTVGSNRKD